MNQPGPGIIVTRSRLLADFRTLGVEPGDTIMLHASVKSVGWIVGGPDVILQSILEVVGEGGTLAMYVGWADGTYDLETWPEATRQAYLAECPAFDPARSRAQTPWSILTERLRTWPGAFRSANPEASMAAVGARAAWLTAEHPMDYGYGPGSPFHKLVECGGKVLLLGSPLCNVTLLHYSECVARVPNKRVVRYRQPVLRGGRPVWIEVEEFDTSNGIADWPADDDYFARITGAFLAGGGGRTGAVGAAQAHLLPAPSLHAFAVRWMEEHLPAPASP